TLLHGGNTSYGIVIMCNDKITILRVSASDFYDLL
ncbi:MAG: hypothetical protein ACI9D5_002645, partial [Candidatus Endobugula sp.]